MEVISQLLTPFRIINLGLDSDRFPLFLFVVRVFKAQLQRDHQGDLEVSQSISCPLRFSKTEVFHS